MNPASDYVDQAGFIKRTESKMSKIFVLRIRPRILVMLRNFDMK